MEKEGREKWIKSLIMNIHLAQEPDDALPKLSFFFPYEIAALHLLPPTTGSNTSQLDSKNPNTHINKVIQKGNQEHTSSAIWFCNSVLADSSLSISYLCQKHKLMKKLKKLTAMQTLK